MTTLLYLFDLQAGVDPADYEHWAQTVDLPRLRSLPSVRSYSILRTEASGRGHLLPETTTGHPSYIEILDVTSSEQFRADMAHPELAKVAATFRRHARTPTVLTCGELIAATAEALTGERPLNR